jgi:methylthioribose-1-phosphate isomerase
MKFSDNIIRDEFDIVFVKRSEHEMSQREESNSNLVDVQTYNIAFDNRTKTPVDLFSIPARDVKIGENIYDDAGAFIAYRSS